MSRRAVPTVLLVAGAYGAAIGLRYATWQWAVELAQISAGIVRYSETSVPFQVHSAIWSLVDQLSALALTAGVSERVLSWVFSAMSGAIACQAVALLALAVTGSIPLAVLSPLLMFITDAMNHGVVYPMVPYGTPHTYGALGLSVAVLAVGLIATDAVVAGAFVLGLSVSVQLTTGVPVVIVGAAGWILAGAPLEWRKRALRGLAAGLAVTGLSLFIHLLTHTETSPLDPSTARSFLVAFAGYWDTHRLPVPWSDAGLTIATAFGVLAAIWYWRLPLAESAPPARWLMAVLTVGAAGGLAAAALVRLPLSMQPSWLIVAMPARLLNISIFAAPVVTLALLASRAVRTRLGRLPLVLFVVALVLSRQSLLVDGRSALALPWPGISQRVVLVAGMLVAATAAAMSARSRATRSDLAAHSSWRRGLVLGASGIALFGFALTAVPARLAFTPHLRAFPDPVWQEAAARPGKLVTAGGLWLVQLRTRRQVLIDGGALDTLPYALDSAPLVEQILNDVYGMSLFAPPREAHGRGVIPPAAHRAMWEQRRSREWQELARRYELADVLTYADWRLDLPLVAESQALRLYRLGSE